ncbi:hypothetical protein GT037_008885 [Alternaria burnsii]|uniref:Uncharacterized protein n=1 Tax=Alternaria burnsii TaxID=1187904 RepID=A0A8H7B109_9PLEO|nr:uncharacterized protein GT037_008885 [Alternaria burnsii]KAF7672934.1 hypothetical protein GT037_008885 [Alternaria burnsii]
MISHTNESTIVQNWNRRVLAIGAVGRSLHYYRLCLSACPTIPILRDFEETSQPAALRLERTRDRLPHCRFQLHDAMSSYLRCQGARARVPPVASMPRAFWKKPYKPVSACILLFIRCSLLLKVHTGLLFSSFSPARFPEKSTPRCRPAHL